MTTKTISDCIPCNHLTECDVRCRGIAHPHRKKTDPCAPIIDADESNEALQIVARIRERNGTDY